MNQLWKWEIVMKGLSFIPPSKETQEIINSVLVLNMSKMKPNERQICAGELDQLISPLIHVLCV